jgi:hypothetical protein
MSPSKRSPSPWQRSRTLATLALAATVALGLALLVLGHAMHGALALLASLLLVRSSALGRRARRQAVATAPTRLPRTSHGH